MATVKQIAKLANVSIGTVSNVLNGLPSVREPARKSVLAAIDQLNYQPSLLGRALRKDKTNMIVMIVPDITNPFFPGVVRGAEDTAFQSGYRLVLCNSDNDFAKEAAYMLEMRTYRPSGLIIVPADLSKGAEEAKAYTKAGSAVVYMDRIPTGWRGDAVTSAHEEGAYQATNYLIELGHKRIATITGPLKGTSAAERLNGFMRAMKEARLPVPAGYIEETTFTKDGGQARANVLLRQRSRPTAIFAANDLIAFGALTAIHDAGLACPDDISVLGFDSLDIGDATAPTLSSVEQFASRLGASAAQIILDRVGGDKGPARRVCIPTSLRVKGSTGSPRVEGRIHNAASRLPVRQNPVSKDATTRKIKG